MDSNLLLSPPNLLIILFRGRKPLKTKALSEGVVGFSSSPFRGGSGVRVIKNFFSLPKSMLLKFLN